MTDKILDEKIASQVRALFAELVEPVAVLYFERADDCQYCPDTRQLLTEITGLSDKLTLHVYDLDRDHEIAARFSVDKAPGIALAAQNGADLVDTRMRFAGIPAGHEFTTLIYDLVRVSKRDSGLADATRQALKDLKDPLHLMVFVTPSCPYCPQAVLLAHQMAMENPLVHAEMIEAMEFPELSERYNVGGVPQTTINYGAGTVVGAVPENHLLAEIQRALNN